ncbi:FMN-binding protein [Mariniphaga sp.]|uniref:FMN-binding protein n=1 Tax=Mariniphaga sp. TaxID=1954475 RepID=UPI0035677F69
MKKIAVIGFLFTFLISVGQGIPGDLPRPVLKELNSQFGKDEFELVEKRLVNQPDTEEKFYLVETPGQPGIKAYIHYGRVKTCRAGGCSLPGNSASVDFDSEYFDYFILFNVDFSVETVKVYNYQASYGHEISARGWLKQFEGFQGNRTLEVGKNIDGITGATVSVIAITDDVKWKTKLLKEAVQN